MKKTSTEELTMRIHRFIDRKLSQSFETSNRKEKRLSRHEQVTTLPYIPLAIK